jgi:hypothetical protein
MWILGNDYLVDNKRTLFMGVSYLIYPVYGAY